MDEHQPTRPRSAAADLLRREREQILRAWEARVRSAPAARRLSEPGLRDHMPRLLEVLAGILDCRTDVRTALGALPDAHALDRLAEGYDVSTAASELAALRAVLLEQLGAEEASADDLQLLNRAIDEVIVRSVDRFTRARERTLRALDRVSSSALGSGDLDQFLPRLLEVLLETTPAADSAYVMLRENGSEVLRIRAAAGVGSELSGGFALRIGEGFAGEVARRREPMLLQDASKDPRVLNPALAKGGVRALYGVPLVHEDRVIGVVKMASRSAHAFSEDDQALFRTAAQRVSTLVVQAQLVSSQARAIEALEHGPGLLVLDRDWRIVLMNAMQEQVTGLRRAEALGRVLWEVWPEAADPRGKLAQEYHRCMHDRVAVAFVEYFAAPGLWCEITGYPSSDGGIVVFFRDVTEQKRVEQSLDRRRWELDELLANTTALVCVAGLDGRLRRVNAAVGALLGYSEAELLAMPLLELVHPRDRPAVVAELERLATGGRTAHFEVRSLCKDGSHRWTSWNASPNRERQLVFAVGRDVTDEKARAAFERDLVGIVSHDLKNPLHAILLSARTLLGVEGNERVARVAGRIQSAAERSVRLVGELLDFTRARVGRGIPLALGPADVHEVARSVVDEVQAASPGREIRLQSSGPGGGEWDAERLAQALTNLVVNAVTYGPPREPVSVSTRGEDLSVTVEVHNRGAPIPPEALPRVFQPYQRGDSERKGGGGSLGLGLFIAREIARGHGGSLDVRSSESEGTTFTLRLPRSPPARPGG